MMDISLKELCNYDLPKQLSSTKEAFANFTLKTRLPKILNKILDDLKSKLEAESPTNINALDKAVIENMESFIESINANSTFKLFEFDDKIGDLEIWNGTIKSQFLDSVFLDSPFLFAECYIYRRIFNIVKQGSILKDYDYFSTQKNYECLAIAKNNNFEKIFFIFEENPNLEFMLNLCLWCNKFDLSFSLSEANKLDLKFMDEIKSMRKMLVVDDTEKVLAYLTNGPKKARADIILDNCGMELFIDLCLGVELIKQSVFEKVYLHFKKIPWFVSDATFFDFDYMMGKLDKLSTDSHLVSLFSKTLKQYVADGSIVLSDNIYWTTPHSYWNITKAPELCWSQIKDSDLLIFKGDLNYRKLLHDCSFEDETSFKSIIKAKVLGNYNKHKEEKDPKILSLRVCKSDAIVGVDTKTATNLKKEDPDWKVSGKHGVIQFSD